MSKRATSPHVKLISQVMLKTGRMVMALLSTFFILNRSGICSEQIGSCVTYASRFGIFAFRQFLRSPGWRRGHHVRLRPDQKIVGSNPAWV
jgi:hypothetical protein